MGEVMCEKLGMFVSSALKISDRHERELYLNITHNAVYAPQVSDSKDFFEDFHVLPWPRDSGDF